jgi:predicted nuclease of restriction endonuclease-like (RecB) superfamily
LETFKLPGQMNFERLVKTISNTHGHFQQQAAKAVNVSLTLRNWLIGFYIVEFEQKGEDRARYGSRLIDTLADSLNTKSLGNRNLKLFRQFYLAYIELNDVISQMVDSPNKSPLPEIMQLSTALSGSPNLQKEIVQSATAQFTERNESYLWHLIQHISFTHFVELLKIKDPTKRIFFELLIIKTTPSVQELKRQIDTLAYERVGLSEKTQLAFQQLEQKIIPEQATDAIKSIYLFDFMGLNASHLVEERDLETAILDHLQAFILELGHGFCFEARQKRILIDDDYFFVDLVFYHRILKCHVLIELKIDSFKHEHLSQLNTYVAYYREEVKRKDDNPPIGILLCTGKGKKLVEYALSGMDNKLFVSKYLLELPKKELLESFITNELQKWNS